MKRINFYKFISIIVILIALSFIAIGALCAEAIDKADRLSASQSSVFSPGYINATKQHTDAIINQVNPNKNIFERAVDYVKDKLSNKVNEEAVNKPVPELKKKTGTAEASATKKTSDEEIQISGTTESPEGTVLISENYKIDIGKGILPHYEDGRLVSEYINGVKHIYAGFSNVGFAFDETTDPIQKAINMSRPGDVIILGQGRYASQEINPRTGVATLGYLSISKDIRIYGGFDDNGVRDISNNKTFILSNFKVGSPVPLTETTYKGFSEFNGLYINGGIILMNNVRLATVAVNRGGYVNSSDQLYHKGDRVGCLVYAAGKTSYYYKAPDGDIRSPKLSGTIINGTPSDLSVTNIGQPREMVNIEKLSGISGQTNLYNSQNVYNYQDTIGPHSLLNWDNNGKSATVLNMDSNKKSSMASMGKALKTDNSLLKGKADNAGYGLAVNTIRNDLDRYALAVNIGIIKGMVGDEDGIKHILANILDNPNDDQKQVLGLVEDLLNEASKIKQDSSSPEAIKKASDDLIQAVAAVLIAQSIPDLLSEGDMANIKSTFTELNAAKEKVLSEYNESIKPYYEETKKVLLNNISVLQLNNIISNSMNEEELEKLDPNEIDKILNKLRKISDKSFAEDYILQQEAKYRKACIEPNQKVLEGRIKELMKDFTRRLSKVLESAKPAQE